MNVVVAKHGSRQGLTLIELIVVLVILIGLAGIIIPLLPNMIGRTHTASGATNIQEVAKLIQTFEALQFRYPDRWDALTDGTAATLPDYLNGTTDLTSAAVGPTGAANLSSAGIANVYAMVQNKASFTANNDATFNPYTTGLGTTITDTTKLATLNATAMVRLQLTATGTYVVLGLGSKSEMIGKGATDVPVHFSDDANQGPAEKYGRFGVIFKVSDSATTMNRAQIVGVVAFHEDGLATAGDHVKEWYSIVKSSQ